MLYSEKTANRLKLIANAEEAHSLVNQGNYIRNFLK